jgi:hypothetical protein
VQGGILIITRRGGMLACGKSGERGDNYLLADEGDAGDVGDCHCLLAVDGGDVELVGAT